MPSDAAAVSSADRFLHGRNRFARYSASNVYMAAGSFGGGSVSYSGIRFCVVDDPVDEVHTAGCYDHSRTANAAEDDDVLYAGDDVVGNVVRTIGAAAVLVLRQYCQLWPADGDQPDE